jgi:hypothetical protein
VGHQFILHHISDRIGAELKERVHANEQSLWYHARGAYEVSKGYQEARWKINYGEIKWLIKKY